MSDLTPISYKAASGLLFINSEKKDTHTFLSGIGACWRTAKLRQVMRKSTLYFSPEPYIFGGHHVVMQTPEGKVYRLETADEKVKKYLEARHDH